MIDRIRFMMGRDNHSPVEKMVLRGLYTAGLRKQQNKVNAAGKLMKQARETFRWD